MTMDDKTKKAAAEADKKAHAHDHHVLQQRITELERKIEEKVSKEEHDALREELEQLKAYLEAERGP